MAFYARFNTPAATNAQMIVELYHISAAIAAYFNRADCYALMAIYAIILVDSYNLYHFCC
jgi:hypothetical protein